MAESIYNFLKRHGESIVSEWEIYIVKNTEGKKCSCGKSPKYIFYDSVGDKYYCFECMRKKLEDMIKTIDKLEKKLGKKETFFGWLV